MRLEARGIFVIVVTGNSAIGTGRAGFEDDGATCIAYHDMQPGAARRVGGRQLVPRLVGHDHVEVDAAGGPTRIPDFNVGRRRGEKLIRALRCGFEFVGRGDDTEFFTVILEIRSMKELPPTKTCWRTSGRPFARTDVIGASPATAGI